VQAGHKLPPLSLKEVDERAKDLIERKTDVSKKRFGQTTAFVKPNHNNNSKPAGEVTVMFDHLKKTPGGAEICAWYNTKSGC
jgi:hypothetical protein